MVRKVLLPSPLAPFKKMALYKHAPSAVPANGACTIRVSVDLASALSAVLHAVQSGICILKDIPLGILPV